MGAKKKPKSYYECVVSVTGSKKEIAEYLKAGKGFSGNFIVSSGFRIYLHHNVYHMVLRDEVGLDNDDVWSEGNFGVVEGNRFVVRFKSTSRAREECEDRKRRQSQVEDCMFEFVSKMRPGMVM